MRRWARCLSLALTLALAAPASGQSAPKKPKASAQEKAEAKKHYSQAQTHFRLGEFEQAITEYKEAYRLYPDPAFLFNIAQCYRQIDDPEQALIFFKNYLEILPRAPNRELVESAISELEALLAARAREQEEAAARAAEAAKLPPVEPESAPAAPEALRPEPAPAPPGEPGASSRRWWLWGTVAGLAAGAGLAASSLRRIPETDLGNTPLFLE